MDCLNRPLADRSAQVAGVKTDKALGKDLTLGPPNLDGITRREIAIDLSQTHGEE